MNILNIAIVLDKLAIVRYLENFCRAGHSNMGLIGRILDKIREWMDRIADVLGGEPQPQPQPIPIPVHDRIPRH